MSENLVELYRPLAWAIAREFWWNGAELEDVRQEAMLALHEASRSWDRRGAFPSFARVVIKRRLIDCVRAADRRPKLVPIGGVEDFEEDLFVTESLEADMEHRWRMRRMLDLVPTLSPRQRDMLGRHLRGESYAEITAATGVSKQAASWHVHRARLKLAA